MKFSNHNAKYGATCSLFPDIVAAIYQSEIYITECNSESPLTWLVAYSSLSRLYQLSDVTAALLSIVYMCSLVLSAVLHTIITPSVVAAANILLSVL